MFCFDVLIPRRRKRRSLSACWRTSARTWRFANWRIPPTPSFRHALARTALFFGGIGGRANFIGAPPLCNFFTTFYPFFYDVFLDALEILLVYNLSFMNEALDVTFYLTPYVQPNIVQFHSFFRIFPIYHPSH